MNKLAFGIFILTFLTLIPAPAYAYLDPGTGGMLLQIIIGAIAGVGVALKMYWHRINAFFGSFRKDKS